MRPPTWQIVTADVRDGLRMLPDESFQCAVTSPPYWGLRDYKAGEQEMGSEGSFVEWVAAMVETFRDLRRVLRRDGTFWLNVGQSYSGGRSFVGSPEGTDGVFARRAGRIEGSPSAVRDRAFKPKDLIMQGPLLAEALRQDGWYLRSACIWAKRNCLPESVTDRPAVAHEYVFLLTKSDRYFYDTEAVRVASRDWSTGGPGTGIKATNHYSPKNGGNEGLSALAQKYRNREVSASRHRRTVWTDEELGIGEEDVWWVNPQAIPARHFATYPEKLVEPCIRAGTSAGGCCPLCGAPHRRVVADRGPDATRQASAGADASGGYTGASTKAHEQAGVQDASAVKARVLAGMRRKETVGWSPTCEHNDLAPVPCAVLDPFSGAGTTGVVALREGRDYIGLELNPEYAAMAEARISDPDWIKKQRARVRAERDVEREASVLTPCPVCASKIPKSHVCSTERLNAWADRQAGRAEQGAKT